MGPQEDYIETVLTCEGDYYDPEFPHQLETFSEQLRHLLLDEKQSLILKKVEPWNSVRVTFNIPKEAAQRLKQLAEQGNHALRALGVLAVQIEGDRVISLTLAGKNDERTELVLRTSDGPAPAAAPSTSMFDLSSNDELNVPGPSNVEATSRNIAQYLSRQGEQSAMFDSIFNVPQSSAGMDMFRSPNVVATMSEPIPFPTPLSQGQFSQSRPLGVCTTVSGQFSSYPPGRSPTGYPTSQGIPSPGYSRSPSASGSPKFPSPMQSPSPSSFQTPPTPPPPYPSMQNINNLPRMVLNKAGMISQSSLLVNLLQNEAAQAAAAGHHINNLPPNKMPPPPPEMSPPQKRKRKKHKEGRKQHLTIAQMTSSPTSASSEQKTEQQKKQRQQPKMAPEDKEKFIAHLDDIMQNIINPDSPTGADTEKEENVPSVHVAEHGANISGADIRSSVPSSQPGNPSPPSNSLPFHQSKSETTDSVVKNLPNPISCVSVCGSASLPTSSVIFSGAGPTSSLSSFSGVRTSYDGQESLPSAKGLRPPSVSMFSAMCSSSSAAVFSSRGNIATAAMGGRDSVMNSNPLCTGTGTTGAMPMFSNSSSTFGSRGGGTMSTVKGVAARPVGPSATVTLKNSVQSFCGPGSMDLPTSTSVRNLPPPDPEPEQGQDPYEGIPPGMEVIINPYTGQLEPIDSINDGSIEGLENDKSNENSKDRVIENRDSFSPKRKHNSEAAAKEKSPLGKSNPEVSHQVVQKRDLSSVKIENSQNLSVVSSRDLLGISDSVQMSKTVPTVSANSRETSVQISRPERVSDHSNRLPHFGIASSGNHTSTSSSQNKTGGFEPTPQDSSIHTASQNSHGSLEQSNEEKLGEQASVTGYKLSAASGPVKSPVVSAHHADSCASGTNGPLSRVPGLSPVADFSRHSPENRVHTSPRSYSDSYSGKSPVRARSPVQINHAIEGNKIGIKEAIFKEKFVPSLPGGLLHLDGGKDITNALPHISLPESVGSAKYMDSKSGLLTSVDSSDFGVSSEMRSHNSVGTLGPLQIDKIKSEISASKDSISGLTNSELVGSMLDADNVLKTGLDINPLCPTGVNCDITTTSRNTTNTLPYIGLRKSPIASLAYSQDPKEIPEVNSGEHSHMKKQESGSSDWSMMSQRSPKVNARSSALPVTNERKSPESRTRHLDAPNVHHSAVDTDFGRNNAKPYTDGQNLAVHTNVRRSDSGYMSMEHISENCEQNLSRDSRNLNIHESSLHNACRENDHGVLGNSDPLKIQPGESLVDGAKIVKENNLDCVNFKDDQYPLGLEDADPKLKLNMEDLLGLDKVAYEKVQQARSKGISILKPLYDRDAELNDEMVNELKDACAVDMCAKLAGKKDAAKVAVSLANSAVISSLQQKSKSVLSIDKLLEDSATKQLPKGDMSGLVNKATKSSPEASQQAISRVPSSKKEDLSNRSASPRNCTVMPNLISKSGSDLNFFNSAPHPITAPIFPFNLTQSVKKVVGPIPSSDRPIKLKPLPSPSSPRSTSPRGHYGRSMSQSIDTSPIATRAHTSPVMSAASRMSPAVGTNLSDMSPKSSTVSPSHLQSPRFDTSVETAVKNLEAKFRSEAFAESGLMPSTQMSVTVSDSLTTVASSQSGTTITTTTSHVPCVTTMETSPLPAVRIGTTSETVSVRTGVSLHNPMVAVPPVSPPVNSALPPKLTDVPLPLTAGTSNSGNSTSCDKLSSSESISHHSKTLSPKMGAQELQSIPGFDAHGTPSILNEPASHLPADMNPTPSEYAERFESCDPVHSEQEPVEIKCDFVKKSEPMGVVESPCGQHACLVAGSTAQLSQGNHSMFSQEGGSEPILPKVEIKVEDTSLRDNDLESHIMQSEVDVKSEPGYLYGHEDPHPIQTPLSSTEHKNEEVSSEAGDQTDNLITKTLRGGRTIVERPESPLLRSGRTPRTRRKTPTLSDDFETKSDTTDRSESPKPTRPQRTKRRILEDGEFHDLVVPNKRTRTLTDDSVGSSKTGNSIDSSEDELNMSDLSSSNRIRSGLKLKVNAKCDDIENMDRTSPRNRRPSSRLEAMDVKRSGRQSRSNSRGATDGTPADDTQDNGMKTRGGSRDSRKPSDDSEKSLPMNTRRNMDRSKAKDKSPPRTNREKSPPRVRSRRNSPTREKKEHSPEPVNRRTTRSTKPKENPDSLPPPATKRRRSSREHR